MTHSTAQPDIFGKKKSKRRERLDDLKFRLGQMRFLRRHHESQVEKLRQSEKKLMDYAQSLGAKDLFEEEE